MNETRWPMSFPTLVYGGPGVVRGLSALALLPLTGTRGAISNEGVHETQGSEDLIKDLR